MSCVSFQLVSFRHTKLFMQNDTFLMYFFSISSMGGKGSYLSFTNESLLSNMGSTLTSHSNTC